MIVGGVVACGHEETANAAAEILRCGGNAVDAAIAGFFTACFAEPVLCALGGAGFALIRDASSTVRALDFFVQTPAQIYSADTLDFERIDVDFGSATQHFFIGNGTVATPGAVAGVFELHREYGSLPISELSTPALEYAKNGALLTAQQAKILKLVEPIYLSRQSSKRQFGHALNRTVLGEGGVPCWSDMIDFMESLSREGSDLFYQGECADKIGNYIQQNGGHVRSADLNNYKFLWKSPLVTKFGSDSVSIFPSPSVGGALIWLALELITARKISNPKSALLYLSSIMNSTNIARKNAFLRSGEWPNYNNMASSATLRDLIFDVENRIAAWTGTTHISVSDNNGLSIGMTLSNGEGCGEIVPGTGMMLNNMLGEPDVNPAGRTGWPLSTRLSSMMSPCIIEGGDGMCTVLGSGGSSRIRSAILQVILNLCQHKDTLERSVRRPRIHLEDDVMNMEGGFSPEQIRGLLDCYPNHRLFDGIDFYFGGVHATTAGNGKVDGYADPRRDGKCIIV